jgi:hypothetical protein
MSTMRSYAPILTGLVLCGTASAQPAFKNSTDTPPPGYTGPTFELSKDFPTTAPPAEPKPWKSFDFKTQPKQYIDAVWAYCREGNEAVDWDGRNNAVRKWYHAPGLAKSGGFGREFIHGLTRERSSDPFELHANQDKSWSNWAVGLYNPAAGFVLGEVWKNPAVPDTTKAVFPDGAVGVKLLFTTAPVSQVPFLSGSKRWKAFANLALSQPKQVRTLRLLQVDIAVRDDRADSTTGWVFGTFMYENTAAGATPYDKLVPVGLMWGNDPDLTMAKVAMGEKPKETWINPDSMRKKFGWNGRLNGPVDNPKSSCLSCHGQAAFPIGSINSLAPSGMPSDAWLPLFVNVKAGQAFKPGTKPLDYSLQLAIGIKNYPGTSGPLAAPVDIPGLPSGAPEINPRSGEPEPRFDPEQDQPEVDDGEGPEPGAVPAHRPDTEKPIKSDNRFLYIAGGFIFIVLMALIMIRKKAAA